MRDAVHGFGDQRIGFVVPTLHRFRAAVSILRTHGPHDRPSSTGQCQRLLVHRRQPAQVMHEADQADDHRGTS